MNTIWRILKMPWRATIKSRKWWSLPILMWATWTMLLGNDAGNLHDVSWQRWVLVAFVLGIATVWSFVSNTLNLARDARGLRLPQVEREADACLLVYALLSIVAPALILGTLFGHTLALATLLLLAAGAVLATRLSPALWAIIAMIPAFLIYMLYVTNRIHVPLPGQPGFLTWAAPLALALACIAILRWTILRRAEETNASSWHSPGVFNVRRTRLGRLRGDACSATIFASNSRDKSRARGLRDVGPDQPVRSIRVALHVTMKPTGIFDTGNPGLSPQHMLAIAVVGIALLVMLVERYVSRAAIVSFEPLVLMLACILTVAHGRFFTRLVETLWRGKHGDLALLALLPGLGSSAQIKRRTLHACVRPGLFLTFCVVLIATAIFVLLRVPAMFYVFLALTTLGGIALSCALTANLLGGRPFKPFVAGTIGFVAIFLAAFSATWGVQVSGGAHPQLSTFGWPAFACLALWVVWCIVFALLALRGWRALQRRPHPFLPNPQA